MIELLSGNLSAGAEETREESIGFPDTRSLRFPMKPSATQTVIPRPLTAEV